MPRCSSYPISKTVRCTRKHPPEREETRESEESLLTGAPGQVPGGVSLANIQGQERLAESLHPTVTPGQGAARHAMACREQ